MERKKLNIVVKFKSSGYEEVELVCEKITNNLINKGKTKVLEVCGDGDLDVFRSKLEIAKYYGYIEEGEDLNNLDSSLMSYFEKKYSSYNSSNGLGADGLIKALKDDIELKKAISSSNKVCFYFIVNNIENSKIRGIREQKKFISDILKEIEFTNVSFKYISCFGNRIENDLKDFKYDDFSNIEDLRNFKVLVSTSAIKINCFMEDANLKDTYFYNSLFLSEDYSGNFSCIKILEKYKNNQEKISFLNFLQSDFCKGKTNISDIQYILEENHREDFLKILETHKNVKEKSVLIKIILKELTEYESTNKERLKVLKASFWKKFSFNMDDKSQHLDLEVKNSKGIVKSL